MNFTVLDWFIVVSYLLGTVWIGLAGKKYIGNVSHYLVAGRELGVYAGIATLAATEIGTITFMYNAELGYKYGFSAFAAALNSRLVMIFIRPTDFLQYVLLSVATIMVTIYAVYHVGWGNAVHKVTATLGEAGFSPIQNPKFGLTFIIWQILLWFVINTCWQTTAMRMFSTKSPETSRKIMMWTGFIYLGRGMLPMLWRIAALTLFGTGRMDHGVPLPIVNGHELPPIDAMPAMLAGI